METPPDNLWLAEIWMQNRTRLLNLLAMKMPPALSRRLSPEDMLQETYLACGKRVEFLRAQPEVPIYVKLRMIALQTLTDLERRHLGAAKRDAMKESDGPANSDSGSVDAWAHFADSISSPRSHMEKLERLAITRRVLSKLSENDRKILELRHFEELGNNECAAVLQIDPKAASIRYVRALKRFQELIKQENDLF